MTRIGVVIDGRPLVGERTGIGVHAAEIAGRLNFEIPPLVASHREIADRHAIERCRFRVDPMPFGVAWQQWTLPRIAREEGVDVVWGPHGTLPMFLDTPAVVTVHDLSSITMPHRHRLKTIASFNIFIGRSLAIAREIAAVSRSTADALMRGFGVASSRITIVPNGVDDWFSPPGPEEIDDLLPEGLPPDGYVLFAGTVEPRKGVETLIEAFHALPSRHRLVICGARGWRSSSLERAIERIPNVVRLGYVDRGTLRALYRHAALFAYPSRHEGFGLPPLEAMACGAPVVASNAGAIPEVAGDGAVLVAPDNPEALSREMGRLLRDPIERRELAARGLERARRFSWEASAKIMRELIARAAGDGR